MGISHNWVFDKAFGRSYAGQRRRSPLLAMAAIACNGAIAAHELNSVALAPVRGFFLFPVSILILSAHP
jgi:hypothetical protein